jgi:hypothetical protein
MKTKAAQIWVRSDWNAVSVYLDMGNTKYLWSLGTE